MEKSMELHSASHDVALRESAPPVSRPLDHARHPSVPNNNNNNSNGSERMSNDVWASAISRLQSQVSYNTGMLESHRRQFTDIEAHLGRMHQEINNMMAAMLEGLRTEMRAELRSRPAPQEPSRHDPADIEVLTRQIQQLTNKLNEVDGLGLQIDMMKNRVKRIEDGASLASTPNHLPATSFRREPPNHEAPPPQPAQATGPHIPHQQASRPPPPPPPSAPPGHHGPLPPMRTGSMPSPQTSRPPSFPGPHAMESQNMPPHRPSSETRPFPGEANATSHPPLGPPGGPGAGYRPGEPLPPPSAISGGWRPAEPYQPPGHSPGNIPATTRGHPAEADSQGNHNSGWATVNNNAAMKRPPEDARSPYGSPMGDNSKRPKLAPLMPNMPRSNYGEENFASSQPPPPHSVPSNMNDASQQPRSRAPSDGSQPPSHPTPASTLQHSFRFITSTQQPDPPESWKPELQREPPPPVHGHGRGGRGGRGRGRGRGGRGRGGAHAHVGPPEMQEVGTPEWERPDWSGGHPSPNGYHNAIHHPHSPRSGSRGAIVRRADAHVPGPGERHSELPATPTQLPPPDPYGAPPDVSMSSSGKKTRTKPIRNAEGILIRKDGRPDMRSVSSANNLRKVHAKKEAERAEMEDDGEGITRSGTPASATAGENDVSDEPHDNSQERQQELMSRLLTHGQGGMDGGRPPDPFSHGRPDEPRPTAPSNVKNERESEADGRSREQSSQATDVVMKEAPEGPGEERKQPTPMARSTVHSVIEPDTGESPENEDGS